MKTKLRIAVLLLALGVAFAGVSRAADAGSQPVGIPRADDVSTETVVDVRIEIPLHADDTEHDIVLYQLTEQPKLGKAEISGATLSYRPGDKVGTDRFRYAVVDAKGQVSAEAAIEIRVRKNKAHLTYADLTDDPAQYSAIVLAERGIMAGETIGGVSFFRPNAPVTRSEFIAMATCAAALSPAPTTQTDFADDGGLSPWAKPFISAAAADGIVCGYPTDGVLCEIRGQNPITMAEACTVLEHLLGAAYGEPAGSFSVEHSVGPDWAENAVRTMAQLSVLTDAEALGDTAAPITRRTACTLLWRTMQMMEPT